jgi:uncharacterized protein (TIGR02646 family)
MRRVIRESLDVNVQENLQQRQAEADRKRREGTLQVHDEWQNARQNAALRSVLVTLKRMMGERERCMYCLDSHGTDIEHFWPKTPYPERLFLWPNLLLCCAECGRLKGDRFPLAEGQPLLIDPTAQEPWLYLDFDPTTGNVVARFDVDANNWSPQGLKTVEVLQLDRREALAVGYRRTFRRLSAIVQRYLGDGVPNAAGLIAALRDADDHGLLGWCFIGTGQNVPPFSALRQQQPDAWATCVAAFHPAEEN